MHLIKPRYCHISSWSTRKTGRERRKEERNCTRNLEQPIYTTHSEQFCTGLDSLLASVNVHGTVPSSMVSRGTALHWRGGPDRCRMVPLTSVNSSVTLATSSAIIFTELIGICDTFPSHGRSSYYTDIDDHKMLQDSCGTLAVNRHVKIFSESSTMRTFLCDTLQHLSRA